jgi:hypothetical protein
MTSLLLPALLLAGGARAAEYRELTLVNGRVITGEIIDSDDTGLVVRVPQGRLRARYEDVVGMRNVDAAVAANVAPLQVLVSGIGVAPPSSATDAAELATRLRAAIAGIPAVRVRTPNDVASAIGPDGGTRLAQCGLDPGCLARVAEHAPVDLVVTGMLGRPSGVAEELTLTGVFVATPRAQMQASLVRAGAVAGQEEEIAVAARTVLGLLPEPRPAPPPVAALPPPEVTPPPPILAPPVVPPPVVPPPVVAVPATPPPPVAAKRPAAAPSPALAWAPVPGLPQFMAGDSRTGLIAVGVAVPATAVFAWAAGAASTSAGEFGLVTALGYYGLCVGVNHAFLPVAVTPMPGGAAVSGRF